MYLNTHIWVGYMKHGVTFLTHPKDKIIVFSGIFSDYDMYEDQGEIINEYKWTNIDVHTLQDNILRKKIQSPWGRKNPRVSFSHHG